MNKAVNQGGVNVNIDDRGLATVEFFHPLSNSLPGKVLAKLANTITELGGTRRRKTHPCKERGRARLLRRCQL